MQLVAPRGGSHSGAWLSTLSTGTRRGALEVIPLPTPGPLEERRAVQGGPRLGAGPRPEQGFPDCSKPCPPSACQSRNGGGGAAGGGPWPPPCCSPAPAGPEASSSLISLYRRAVVRPLWTLCQHRFLKNSRRLTESLLLFNVPSKGVKRRPPPSASPLGKPR